MLTRAKNIGTILYIIIVIGILSLFVPLIFYFRIFNAGLSESNLIWGTFGDYIGGIASPILSFLALIAILITLRYQRQELEKTFQSQKDEKKNAQHLLFTQTIFNMLRLHNEIVENIQHGNATRSRSAFKKIFQKCELQIVFDKPDPDGDRKLKDSVSIDDIEQGYPEFMKNFGDQVGHYFKNLYRIFKYIDKPHEVEPIDEKLISTEKKLFYSGLIRAQLSNYEVALLFYQSIWSEASKFQEYIDKYHLLENIDISVFTNFTQEYFRMYSESAFGESYKDLSNKFKGQDNGNTD